MMIRRLFSKQTRTITGAAIILAIASFASRLMGVFRDRIFAHYFGAGNILDTYYAAFRIPDLVYNLLIVGALTAGFIPVFMELLTKDKEEAWNVANAIINILGLFLLIACTILFIFTPQFMHWIVPGFSNEKLRTTIVLTRIMFLSPIILGISSVVSGVLQCFRSFFIYALTPILYNTGIIIGAIFFVPIWGINGLAYGVILGAILHLIIQLPTFFQHGFHYKPMLLLKNKHVRKIASMTIPSTLGLATNQLNLTGIMVLASTLGAGSIAVYNLANNLQYAPVGIIGISFALAAFPTLSQFVSEGKLDAMINHFIRTVRQILFFIIPLTIILLLLRAQIVRVLLGTGQFTWTDTIETANTLAFFSLSLFAQSLIPMIVRVFYSVQDIWTPLWGNLAGAVITILLALYLKNILGISGIALSYSIAMVIQLIILWLLLRKKIGSLKEGKIFILLAKISIAAVLMAFTIQGGKIFLGQYVNMTRLWGIAIQGIVSATVGLIVYGLVLRLMKLEEMSALQQTLKKNWYRMVRIPAHIDEPDDV